MMKYQSAGRNNLGKVVRRNSVYFWRKEFVDKKNAHPYGFSDAIDPDKYDFTVKNTSAMKKELKGYEALKRHYKVPNIGLLDEENATIEYEYLPKREYRRADEIIKDLIGKRLSSERIKKKPTKLEEKILRGMEEFGRDLRTHHDSEDGSRVKHILDLYPENLMIGVASGSDPYKLIDFESFGETSKINSLMALPSTMYPAISSGTELEDGEMLEADRYIRRFFEGYLSKGTPQWLKDATKTSLDRYAALEEAIRGVQLYTKKVESNRLQIIVESVSEILREIMGENK